MVRGNKAPDRHQLEKLDLGIHPRTVNIFLSRQLYFLFQWMADRVNIAIKNLTCFFFF